MKRKPGVSIKGAHKKIGLAPLTSTVTADDLGAPKIAPVTGKVLASRESLNRRLRDYVRELEEENASQTTRR